MVAKKYQDTAYLKIADWAYQYLSQKFWDSEFQGVYWSLNAQGQTINNRKHTYAQAFTIYGLSAYYQTSHHQESLALAKTIFALIDQYTYDDIYGGNIECRNRDWSPMPDMRLSTKEINSTKSMNTLLHLMEAYAALYTVWPDALLKKRLADLVNVFLKKIIDPSDYHQQMFFDIRWQSLLQRKSFGHDIEASWLLLECAEITGEPKLIQQAKECGVKMAQAVYDQAYFNDGSILYERDADGRQVKEKHWWAHAEAVVGFYNAYQLSSEKYFYEAAMQVWQYIQTHFVDQKYGDWYKILRGDGSPILSHIKVGPWECPYHHARMCMEMSKRLNASS